MRRWEDWERSRLRKLKREERRRNDFDRLHPHGFPTGSEADFNSLKAEIRSQYDGSDTLSLASSDEDQWGSQIGGYNENHPNFAPPPPTLYSQSSNNSFENAKTVDESDLEAMLEAGFDDEAPPVPSMRYQLSDDSTTQLVSKGGGNAYAPLGGNRMPPSVPSAMSPTSPIYGVRGGQQNSPPRSGPGGYRPQPERTGTGREKYGPLGPLDPTTRF